jgi:NADH-quinone oxidoreductase subunit L
MGAMGKSAQFLLHTWLPDAMEGPTPVSALIHAATMVTAGVFLVARMSPIFEYAPNALAFRHGIGGTTAFFAATVGLVQNDIKRVIAYSTCSQLGYMFVALGVGAYSVGDLPSVHPRLLQGAAVPWRRLGHPRGLHEQDMRRMGGLWKHIPIHLCDDDHRHDRADRFPYTAGYFSKDAIIEAPSPPAMALPLCLLDDGARRGADQSFYSWRLIFLTFHGTPRARRCHEPCA